MSFGKWDPSVHDNFEQLKRRVSAAKIAEDDIELDLQIKLLESMVQTRALSCNPRRVFLL